MSYYYITLITIGEFDSLYTSNLVSLIIIIVTLISISFHKKDVGPGVAVTLPPVTPWFSPRF